MVFFPVWVRYGYFHFFGSAWEDANYWADFVDDSIIFVMSVADGDLKRDLMDMSKTRMGLKRSPKQPLDFFKETVFAGLVWTTYGVTIGNEAVKYILDLLCVQPKGVKQARTLRGVIVQAKSAFVFSANELIRFGQLVGMITACIDRCDRTSKWIWSEDGKDALEELSTRLGDCKRRYTNPDNILAHGSSLATLGDAGPEAIVCSLWIIQQHDANDITPKDFYEDSAVLLGMHPKTLNKAQQRMGEVIPLTFKAFRKSHPLDNEQGYANVYVDALFGTGLTRPLEGEAQAVIHHMSGINGDRYDDRTVAVDAPSGICLDSGRWLFQMPASIKDLLGKLPDDLRAGLAEPGEPEPSLQARITVTFDSPKVGHFVGAGTIHCGRVVIKDIGLERWRCFKSPFVMTENGPVGAQRQADICLTGQEPIVEDRRNQVSYRFAAEWLGKSGRPHKYAHGHALVLFSLMIL